MNEKPIIFNSEMVKAILDKRKTITRRVVKPQPVDDDRPLNIWIPGSIAMDGVKFQNIVCQYGKTGDYLWVRETFQESFTACLTDPKQSYNDIIYKADGKTEYNFGGGLIKWKPSIFMFRKDSRINLKIINIRVERLQDISGKDAIAEGWPSHEEPFPLINAENKALAWFKNLWELLNKKKGYGWNENPWVWVIKFPEYK